MPAVSVQCPHCSQFYSVDDSLVGRRARCKHCGMAFAIAPSGELSAPGSSPSTALASTAGSALSDWSSGIPIPKQIGRFLIKKRLGAGACGTVYHALDPTLDRDVALKVPHSDLQRDEKAVSRFLREAKAAAKLRHPHVVTVYEAGTDGETSYIASAFIAGQSLADAIDEGPFEPRRAARIVAALADGLHAAHQQGIVHRDVKPANILLDGEDRPHLTDFGLARLAASSVKLTKVGSILGTPAYLAPEQARGKSDQAEPASDQYSLGVTLYELLSGEVPFAGPLEIVIFHTLNTPPPPLRVDHPEVPVELERICLRALFKKPEERYATCREMAKDLAKWLAGRSTDLALAARPPDAGTLELEIPPLVATAGSAVRESSAVSSSIVEPQVAQPPELPPRWSISALLRLTRERPLFAGAVATSLLAPLTAVVLYHASQRAAAPVQRRGDLGLLAKLSPSPENAASESGSNHLKANAPKTTAANASAAAITNSIGMTFNLIPAGEFLMGSPDGDPVARRDEKPQHRVRIARPFYLGVYELTQTQYQTAMRGSLNSVAPVRTGTPRVADFSGDRLPAVHVTLLDAIKFCNKLSELEGSTAFYEINGDVGRVRDWNGTGYRLPTEAEWEYACRANSPAGTRFSFGDEDAKLGDFAWYAGNSDNRIHPVGLKRPNALGLFDMHGNVWEWCWDAYGPSYYKQSPLVDPHGDDDRSTGLSRGGGWRHVPRYCRSAFRGGGSAIDHYDDLGLRVARSVPVGLE